MLDDDFHKTERMMIAFESNGIIDGTNSFDDQGISLLEKCRNQMKACRSSDQEILFTIRTLHQQTGYIVDPHTACGVSAFKKLTGSLQESDVDVVCLGCAHWGKFLPVVKKAITADLSLPSELEALKTVKASNKTLLEANEEVVLNFIRNKLICP